MKKVAFVLKIALCAGRLQLLFMLGINLLQGVVLSLEIIIWQQLVDGIVFCLDEFLFRRILIPIGCYMILEQQIQIMGECLCEQKNFFKLRDVKYVLSVRSRKWLYMKYKEYLKSIIILKLD